MLVADGFEDAFIGVTISQPSRNELAVYSFEKCIDVLMKRDGMSDEEAIEFFLFNVSGAYMGEDTPIFIEHGEYRELQDNIAAE